MPVEIVTLPGTAAPFPGCSSCQQWARLKAERKLPVAGDTYCAECGAREADVSRAVKARMRQENDEQRALGLATLFTGTREETPTDKE